jgi:hypothetical protein
VQCPPWRPQGQPARRLPLAWSQEQRKSRPPGLSGTPAWGGIDPSSAVSLPPRAINRLFLSPLPFSQARCSAQVPALTVPACVSASRPPGRYRVGFASGLHRMLVRERPNKRRRDATEMRSRGGMPTEPAASRRVVATNTSSAKDRMPQSGYERTTVCRSHGNTAAWFPSELRGFAVNVASDGRSKKCHRVHPFGRGHMFGYRCSAKLVRHRRKPNPRTHLIDPEGLRATWAPQRSRQPCKRTVR